MVQQRTAKSRPARAVVAIKDWCRTNRHLSIPTQRGRLAAKLVGHYAYYGITGNSTQLGRYFHQVTKTWRKWLERRERAKSLPWEKFLPILARHPLPPPKIMHRYAAVSESLS